MADPFAGQDGQMSGKVDPSELRGCRIEWSGHAFSSIYAGVTLCSKELGGYWGIVELMGHAVVAGYVTRFVGLPLIQVVIPPTQACDHEVVQIYHVNAIYCVTQTTEETARAWAEDCGVVPGARMRMDSRGGDDYYYHSTDNPANYDQDEEDM